MYIKLATIHIYMEYTRHFIHMHTHKVKPHPLTIDTALDIEAPCKPTHTCKNWSHFHRCVEGHTSTHIHTHRQVRTDSKHTRVHTQTEDKSNKSSHKDKRLCSLLLSSLNDSAQRHELNLGLSSITPKARKGEKGLGHPLGDPSISRVIHVCACLVQTPGDFSFTTDRWE